MKDYLCAFKPDMRAIELHERLQKYYDETPDQIDCRTLQVKWKEFTVWCDYFGYTREDVNRAITEKYNQD